MNNRPLGIWTIYKGRESTHQEVKPSLPAGRHRDLEVHDLVLRGPAAAAAAEKIHRHDLRPALLPRLPAEQPRDRAHVRGHHPQRAGLLWTLASRNFFLDRRSLGMATPLLLSGLRVRSAGLRVEWSGGGFARLYIYTAGPQPWQTRGPRGPGTGRSMNILPKECAINWHCWEMVGNFIH